LLAQKDLKSYAIIKSSEDLETKDFLGKIHLIKFPLQSLEALAIFSFS